MVFLTNRVQPTRENQKIAKIRPALHDAVMQSLGFTVPEACWDAQYRMYHGDNVSIGRGEVLIRETPNH